MLKQVVNAVDLARAISVARSGMVRLVDELEERGLISREISANDSRNRTPSLTDSGMRKLPQLERTVARHEARLTEGLEAGGGVSQSVTADPTDSNS